LVAAAHMAAIRPEQKVTQKLHKNDAGMTAKSRPISAQWMRRARLRRAQENVHTPGVGARRKGGKRGKACKNADMRRG
jgi:hypothetical protein